MIGGAIPLALHDPAQIGATVQHVAETLAATDAQVPPQALLYAAKQGGFQCGTCAYVRALNATHGRCVLIAAMHVHLQDGCCIAWKADTRQLHRYDEPQG